MVLGPVGSLRADVKLGCSRGPGVGLGVRGIGTNNPLEGAPLGRMTPATLGHTRQPVNLEITWVGDE